MAGLRDTLGIKKELKDGELSEEEWQARAFSVEQAVKLNAPKGVVAGNDVLKDALAIYNFVKTLEVKRGRGETDG